LHLVWRVDADENYWMLVIDNFLTSVKMASALFKVGWTLVGTISKKSSTGIPLEGDTQRFQREEWKIRIRPLQCTLEQRKFPPPQKLCPGSWTGSGGRGPGDIFAKTNEFQNAMFLRRAMEKGER